MLREFKPRKAKYGFTTGVYSDILDVSEVILMAIGKPDKKGEAWFVEIKTNMGKCDMSVYINDVAVYERLKAAVESAANV